MISLLRGEIAEKSLGHVVLDVGGVGYGVAVPLCTYYKLPGVGDGVTLKIYTSVREDAITLYGFLTEDERRLFNLLIGVSGIGPKAATNILSNAEPAELVKGITTGGLKKKKIPGIGPKLASRLVTELKDKLVWFRAPGADDEKPAVLEDIVSALQNLGYKRAEVDARITELEEISLGGHDLEGALRESLKVMGR